MFMIFCASDEALTIGTNVGSSSALYECITGHVEGNESSDLLSKIYGYCEDRNPIPYEIILNNGYH